MCQHRQVAVIQQQRQLRHAQHPIQGVVRGQQGLGVREGGAHVRHADQRRGAGAVVAEGQCRVQSGGRRRGLRSPPKGHSSKLIGKGVNPTSSHSLG